MRPCGRGCHMGRISSVAVMQMRAGQVLPLVKVAVLCPVVSTAYVLAFGYWCLQPAVIPSW
jgi:nitrate reductase NapE component